jgi:hypothetical protein
MSLSPSRERPCKFDVMRSLSFAEAVFGCVCVREREPTVTSLVSHNKKLCGFYTEHVFNPSE